MERNDNARADNDNLCDVSNESRVTIRKEDIRKYFLEREFMLETNTLENFRECHDSL